ncbi:MAG: Abi family protein [Candidatus Gastranaerophilales bacterium]|nr:Abi family protein [Candidatus Gastranaerophilales bacterium]
MAITEDDLKQYANTLSIERLRSFIQSKDDSINEVLERYNNNIQISQAFYPELSILEVTLRNAINSTLCKSISSTWLENEISQQTILLDHDYEILLKAHNDILKEYPKKNYTIGKVIANLTFGFWTNLCSKRYNARIWTKKGCFQGVFSNYPSNLQQQIHLVSNKLRSIRKLRNRIFHYEPILKDPALLLNKYNEILELINYLPHNNPAILKNTSNFLDVYNRIVESNTALNKAKT